MNNTTEKKKISLLGSLPGGHSSNPHNAAGADRTLPKAVWGF